MKEVVSGISNSEKEMPRKRKTVTSWMASARWRQKKATWKGNAQQMNACDIRNTNPTTSVCIFGAAVNSKIERERGGDSVCVCVITEGDNKLFF